MSFWIFVYAFIAVIIYSEARHVALNARNISNSTIGQTRSRVGDLRLRGGRNAEEGNIEIFYNNRWGAICDDDWDIADATVACRQLGYDRGAITFTTDSHFGRFSADTFLDNLKCTGHESRLDSCRHDGWNQHDCNSMESAGVVCKPNPPPPADVPAMDMWDNSSQLIPISDIFNNEPVRIDLKNGRTQNEGRVEFVQPRKGAVCAEGWSLKEASVVCRQFGLGYAQQAVQGHQFGIVDEKETPVLFYTVSCTGDESDFSQCKALEKPTLKCQSQWLAGVVCSEELPDLHLDLELVRDSVYLHDHSLHYLQCAMEENCLSSSAERLMKESAWYYRTRRLLRFSTKVQNIGDADFLPDVAKNQWQWHQCHMHYHSMEIFSHYDIYDPKTKKHVAEGHKASFCLEDSDCEEGVRKRYRCAGFGDQGISPGCWDTYLHDIDCQWIDISDLTPGTYVFKVAVNPQYKIGEKNFSNNAVLCDLYYDRTRAVVNNCVYTVP